MVTAWLLVCAAAVGLLAGEVWAAVLGVAVIAPGVVVGLVASDRSGLTPSGEMSRSGRTLAVSAAVIAGVNALAAIVWAAAGHPSVAAGAILVGVALACQLVALRQMVA